MSTRFVWFLIWSWTTVSWTTAAWAKTITIPRGSINESQFLNELVARFPDWLPPKSSAGPPRFRAESNDQTITLVVPDEANEAEVQAVIAAHVPRPRAPRLDYDTLEAHVRALEDKVQRVEAAVGLAQTHTTPDRLRSSPSPGPSPSP